MGFFRKPEHVPGKYDPVTAPVKITPLPPRVPPVEPLRGKDLQKVLDEEAAKLAAKTNVKIPPARRLVRSSAELEQ